MDESEEAIREQTVRAKKQAGGSNGTARWIGYSNAPRYAVLCVFRWVRTVRTTMIALLIALASPLHAQLADPTLPSAEPEALQHLSDNRVRQQIMQESQMRFSGRCVCSYQTKDSKMRSCKGRHEVIKTRPAPICYPSQVTSNMMSEWRQHHP